MAEKPIPQMKNVAIIAPDFPPSSMPTALRVRLLVEHLREYGWDPVVITTDPSYYENPADEENLRLLSGGYEVIRTRAFPARFTRKFGLGDLGLRSFLHHWRALAKLIGQRKIDLVFVSVPPVYSMMLGRLANLRFGVPYVIDFQDPYITDFYKTVPDSQRLPKWRLARALAEVVEPFSLRRAVHIVSVDKAYVAGVIRRYPWLSDEDVTGVQLGVEPRDFDYLRQHPRRHDMFDNSDGFIHVSYVGRGGPDMRAAARALFLAVKKGLAEEPELFRRIRLHFVGTDYARAEAVHYHILPVAQEVGVERYVHEHPARVPFLTALQILIDSRALVVLGSTEAHYTPSKIFPYILAQKPLLGIFHESSAVIDILRQTCAGDVVTFNVQCPPEASVDQIYVKLCRIVTALPPTNQKWDAFEPYTAKAVTERLAAAFEAALAKGKR